MKFFQVLALLFFLGRLGDVAVLAEVGVGVGLFLEHRHDGPQLGEYRCPRLILLLRLSQALVSACEFITMKAVVVFVLDLDLSEHVARVARGPAHRRAQQLGVHAAQLQGLCSERGLHRLLIGLRIVGVQPQQHLAGLHGLAFVNEDILHDAGLRRLHDLDVALGHEPPFGTGDNVQLANACPDHEHAAERGRQPQHDSRERCWWPLLDREQLGGELQALARQ